MSSSRINLIIHKADNVQNADGDIVNNHYHGTSESSTDSQRNANTVQEETAGDAGRHLNASPPTVDGNSVTAHLAQNDSQNDRFPTPVQVSGEDGISVPDQSMTETPSLPPPIPVEFSRSADYISVGHTQRNNSSGLQSGAVLPGSATSLEELKAPMSLVLAQDSAGSLPVEDTGDHPQTTCHRPAQCQEQTSPKICAAEQDLESPEACVAQADISKQTCSFAGPCTQIDSGVGSMLHSLVTDYGSLAQDGPMPRPDSAASGGCGTGTTSSGFPPTALSSVQCDVNANSGNSSITTAGGQRASSSAKAAEKDIIVAVKGNLLLQDEGEPSVLVVDLHVQEDLLRESTQNGFFPEGASELLAVRWYGFRQFEQTRWCLKMDTEIDSSEQRRLVQSFSTMMLDRHSELVRRVLKQLQHDHAVYLQGIVWTEGIVIHLGHFNRDKCHECMQSDHKEEITKHLLQLLPEEVAEKFTLEGVTLREDQDSVASRPSQMVLSGGTLRSSSINSADMYGCCRGSSGTPSGGESVTFHESSYPSDHSSQYQLSPSVDVIESSSPSSIQLLSPQNSDGNRVTLESLLFTQNKEKFQAMIRDQLASHLEAHRREMDDLRQNHEEAARALRENMTSQLSQLQEQISETGAQAGKMDEQLSRVEEQGRKLEDVVTAVSEIREAWSRQQETTAELQKSMQEKGKSLLRAKEDTSRLYANYETRGRQLLSEAILNVQEKASQREKQQDAMLQTFKTHLLSQVVLKSQNEDFLGSLQTRVCKCSRIC